MTCSFGDPQPFTQLDLMIFERVTSLNLMFYDRDIAEKVADGLRCAVEYCSGSTQ
jgi:hypothetical protein